MPSVGDAGTEHRATEGQNGDLGGGDVGGVLFGHTAEDVVGGTVDDRYAIGQGRLNQGVHATRCHRCGDLLAMAGHHYLVGGHCQLPAGDGSQDGGTGRVVPPITSTMICTTGSSTTTLRQQGKDVWQFLEQDWMIITAVI